MAKLVQILRSSANLGPDSRLAVWRGEGCALVNRTEDLAVCACDHLTSFAAMASNFVTTLACANVGILSVLFAAPRPVLARTISPPVVYHVRAALGTWGSSPGQSSPEPATASRRAGAFRAVCSCCLLQATPCADSDPR